VQAPAVMKELPYDTLKDLAPITKLMENRLYFLVNSKVPAKTLREFITYAKENPNKINFASYGNGTSSHLILAKLSNDSNIEVVHVPYKGPALVVQALASGEVSAGVVGNFDARPQIQAGRIRALAVNGETRDTLMPEIPTFEEAGSPGFGFGTWGGLF